MNLVSINFSHGFDDLLVVMFLERFAVLARL